jgi:class 3 adenylate cyclase/tetratricopeptide (TPR) repeat protein
MRCPRCEHECAEGHKFCGQCGAKLPHSPAMPAFRSAESYTPGHLARKILTARAALEGERKQVTILFADLKDSMELLADRDPEEARTILDPVLERMMEAIHLYEGTVNQVMGDGIMAIFGAPLAHEDHAVRACLAALRMQESVGQYADAVRRAAGVPIQIRVGMNSGEVVVRAIRNDLHMDYSAVGQTTHLAARMEQLATPGAIVLTEYTLRLVEGYVRVRPLGPTRLKGLDAPLAVYQVLGASPLRSRFQATVARGLGRFVGRHEELEQLRKDLERTLSEGRVVALAGEPGVGKSRLALEVGRAAWAKRWRLLETGAAPYSKATPFTPIIGLLKTYFAIEEGDDDRTIREKVGRTLAPSLARAAPALLALLNVPLHDPEWLELDPPERRRRTLDAAQALLVEESTIQPLLLVFEDLQWIDSETQALLDSLVDILPTMRVLLLVTYRPEYQHAWANKPAYTQLRVDPLIPDSAAELLDALVGTHPELNALRALLINRAEGNPFYLEESVRTLVETRMLAGERGAYRLAGSFVDVPVPTTVRAVLAARVDRLATEDKHLLQSAAAIGHDVPLALLGTVTRLDEKTVRQGLARLQDAGFLYEAGATPEPQYTFKHALTQEVAYGALLHEQCRVLDERIVEAMERVYSGRLGEKMGRLAHHAFRGEVWDRAVEYLHTAGRRALFASANAEAVEMLEQALVALRHLPQGPATLKRAVAIRLTLRDALWSLGRIRQLHHHLQEAEAIARLLDDQRTLGRVACYQCHYFWAVGELDAAQDAGRRALEIANTVGDAMLIAEIELYRSIAFLARGEAERAAQALRRTVADLDRLATECSGVARRPTAIALLVRCFLTRSLAELGRFEEGIACGQEALRLAEANSTAFGLVTALAGLGSLYLRRSEPQPAISLLERGLDLCRSYRINNWLPTVGATLGAAYTVTGRVDEAVRLLEEAVRLASEMGVRATLSLWRGYLAEAYLRAGRGPDALEEAQQALAECQARGELGYEAWLLHVLGRIGASQEPPDAQQARTSSLRALDLAERLGMRPLVARCVLELVRLSERIGDTTAASAYRERAGRLAVELGMPLVPLETP